MANTNTGKSTHVLTRPLGLANQYDAETLAAHRTLTRMDGQIAVLDPNGSSYNVLLPVTTAKGRIQVVINSGTATADALAVQTPAAGALRTQAAGEAGFYQYVDPTTGWKYLFSSASPTVLGGTGAGLGASLVGIEDSAAYYAATDVEAALVALGVQLGGDSDVTFNFTEANVLADDDAVYAALEKLDIQAGQEFDQGSIPVAILDMTTAPTATDTVTIGADVYEFVAAAGDVALDANIAVARTGTAATDLTNLVAAINADDADNQHATIFLTDSTTPAVANGTEAIVATVVGATCVIQTATAAGGTKASADPSIVLAEALTPAASIWDVGNVNLNGLGGKAAAERRYAVTSVAVTAAMITAGYVRLDFPWQPAHFFWEARTSADIKRITQNDDVAATANGLLVTLAGGGAPDIQATDVITVQVFE